VSWSLRGFAALGCALLPAMNMRCRILLGSLVVVLLLGMVGATAAAVDRGTTQATLVSPDASKSEQRPRSSSAGVAGLVGVNGLGIWSVGSRKKVGSFDPLKLKPYRLSPHGKIAWFRETGRTNVGIREERLGRVEVSNLNGSGKVVVHPRVAGVSEIAWSRDGRVVFWFHRVGSPDLRSGVSWFNLATRQRGTYVEPTDVDSLQSSSFESVAVAPSGRELAAKVSVISPQNAANSEEALVTLQLDRSGSYRKLRKIDVLKDNFRPLAWTAQGIIAHRQHSCRTFDARTCRHDLVLISPTSGKIIRKLRSIPAQYPQIVGVTAAGRWFAATRFTAAIVGPVQGRDVTRLSTSYDDFEES
jgi:hypothetical protein